MATIIVPFVHGKLHPDTLKAVQYSGWYCRFVDLDPNDDGAYGRLVRQLWRSRTTVVICEHDVVPTREQLREVQQCDHDWCSYDYDHPDYHHGPMFGFVRFSGRLMDRHPQAAEAALTVGSKRDREAQWRHVDSLMAQELIRRKVAWVCHEGAVHHAHNRSPVG